MLIKTLHYYTACGAKFALVRSENRLAGKVILDIFWTVSSKGTIYRPEYWLSAICLENCDILHSVWGLYDK